MPPAESQDRVFHPDIMVKIVGGIAVAAIVSGVGILWTIRTEFASMRAEVSAINLRLGRLEESEKEGSRDRYTAQQATADLTLIRTDIGRNRDRTDALDARLDVLATEVARLSATRATQ